MFYKLGRSHVAELVQLGIALFQLLEPILDPEKATTDEDIELQL
jgi:hypothetical protein